MAAASGGPQRRSVGWDCPGAPTGVWLLLERSTVLSSALFNWYGLDA